MGSSFLFSLFFLSVFFFLFLFIFIFQNFMNHRTFVWRFLSKLSNILFVIIFFIHSDTWLYNAVLFLFGLTIFKTLSVSRYNSLSFLFLHYALYTGPKIIRNIFLSLFLTSSTSPFLLRAKFCWENPYNKHGWICRAVPGLLTKE